MKSKSTLTLMELLIMLVVFAVAAALCLRTFAGAGQISKDAAALDRAVTEVQSAAETLKGCAGNYEKAAALWGGSWDGTCWTVEYESGSLRALPAESGNPLLEQAVITAVDPEGSPLYTLTVGWQKGGGSHG